MLASIGQSPVNTLEVSGIPDVTRARRFLRETLLDVQTHGWSWNRDTSYALQPDPDGNIVIPASALEVDPSDKTVNYVVRWNSNIGALALYDPEEQTFTFEEPVEVDITWAFEFNELPQAARTYVAIAASRKFQAQTVSSAALDGYNQADEDAAWRRLARIERRTRDTNSFRVNREASRMLRRRF